MNEQHLTPLPPQPFRRNEKHHDFVLGHGFYQGKNSHMYYLQPGGSRYDFPLQPVIHNHDYYELIYITEGIFTQHLEGSLFRLGAGDVALLNTRIHHCEGLETNCRCLYLQLSPAFLQELLYTNPVQTGTHQHASRLFQRFCSPDKADTSDQAGVALVFRRTLNSQSPITEIPDKLSDILTKADWGYGFQIQALLLQLFQTLENPEEYYSVILQTDSNSDEIIYQTALHYIKERHGRLTRDELSSLLHYNPDYLNRVIRRHSGQSFKQLSQQILLSYVQKQLQTSDTPISELLESLDYSNKSHFYQIFRQTTGMTPLEYRAQYQSHPRPE